MTRVACFEEKKFLTSENGRHDSQLSNQYMDHDNEFAELQIALMTAMIKEREKVVADKMAEKLQSLE